MLRVDQALVQLGLAASRSAAKRLIDAGAVSTERGELVLKTSQLVTSDVRFVVAANVEDKFASRAGHKLNAVLDEHGIKVAGLHCIDLGQSTGGFTDCLLSKNAAGVIGFDVGHSQLVERLRSDSRVMCFEGVNVRHLQPENYFADADFKRRFEKTELVVADLSFISLTLVLPAVAQWLNRMPHTVRLVCLVKPQFEVGKGNVNRQGVVTDKQLFEGVRERIEHCIADCGWQPRAYVSSAILGGDGNQEFFVHAVKPAASSAQPESLNH